MDATRWLSPGASSHPRSRKPGVGDTGFVEASSRYCVARQAVKSAGSWEDSRSSQACWVYLEFAVCAGGYRREAAWLMREVVMAARSEVKENRFAADWGRLR